MPNRSSGSPDPERSLQRTDTTNPWQKVDEATALGLLTARGATS